MAADLLRKCSDRPPARPCTGGRSSTTWEGFDESFFAYLEDVDLAWRARLAGWRCWYVAAAAVRHEHSATAIEGSPFKNFHLGRNKVLSILKNYPLPHLLLHAPFIVLYDLGAIPYTLVSRRDPSILLGRLAALLKLREVLGKRSAIQRSRRVGWSELSETLDGLHSPWALFRRYFASQVRSRPPFPRLGGKTPFEPRRNARIHAPDQSILQPAQIERAPAFAKLAFHGAWRSPVAHFNGG